MNVMRKVGQESQKSYQYKIDSGFFDEYMSGRGLDVGYAGYIDNTEPILPRAIGVDLSYPNYDGKTLPFPDASQDYVYSSHCLEHIDSPQMAIREWFRVVKTDGYIVCVVPHKYLYEKRNFLPSKWNGDHKRFYTPGSLLIEIENSLEPNSYRVRLLEDNDKGFDYSLGPDMHSGGEYEITLVLQKIEGPKWRLD